MVGVAIGRVPLVVARVLRRSGAPARRGRAQAALDCRLYEREGTRLEAHLGRRGDGRLVVVVVSLGRRGSQQFLVDGERPWEDFERRAGLRGASWGACRDATAGI